MTIMGVILWNCKSLSGNIARYEEKIHLEIDRSALVTREVSV